MTDDPLDGATAAEIGRRLLAEGGGARALTERLLAAIEVQSSPVFLTVTADRALAEADAADARLAAGRPLSQLDGVPFAWKDLVDIVGTPTTAASALYRDAAPATSDAPVVVNAARAGLVTLGKLNLAEFAFSALGQNPHFGTPLNPRAAEPHAPGGSSSGSGVAVGAGLAPITLGSDTGGSIRIPASFCGVVGFKTSEGHIPLDQVFPLSRTQDTLGPLGRSVEDCALSYNALRGAPGPAPRPAPLDRLAIVVPEGSILLSELDADVVANFEAALARLADAGAVIRREAVPALDEAALLIRQVGSILSADSYFEHRALFESGEIDKIDQRVRARIEIGRNMSAADMIALLRQRAKGQVEIAAQLDGAFLAMPTTAGTAPSMAALEESHEAFHRLNLRANRNTNIGSLYNMPGLSVPSGTDAAGLPTSFLLSAPADQDIPLLRAGLAAEPVIRTA